MTETIRPIAIIQARLGSNRLPNKVLLDVNGKTMLARVIERCLAARLRTIVAIPDSIESQLPLRKACEPYPVLVYEGPEDDVLGRYMKVFSRYRDRDGQAMGILRVTADCPLIDPRLIERVAIYWMFGPWNYVAIAITKKPSYPDGMDCECFSLQSLTDANRKATSLEDREHVTPWIQRNVKSKLTLRPEKDLSYLGKLSVDTQDDLNLVQAIERDLHRDDYPFGLNDIIKRHEFKEVIRT